MSGVTFHGTAQAGVRSVAFEATIIRADGTTVPLGEVAYWHRNPLRRWRWRLRNELARRIDVADRRRG